MKLDAANLLRALMAASIASCMAAGCTHTVHTFGEGDSDGCGDPPASSGWCPPAWSCVDGEWVDTAGACPDPCPEDRPAEDSACEVEGAMCTYESSEGWDCGGGEWTTVKVQCTAEGWTTLSNHCQPEPECPDEAPIAGGDCTGWYYAYSCGYPVETSCGSTWLEAYCDFSAPDPTWDVTLQEECSAGCGGYGDAATCESSAACRWLEPGCAGEPLAQAGCHPVEPCGPDTCAAGETCATVSVDPCWSGSCDACAADTAVCAPQ